MTLSQHEYKNKVKKQVMAPFLQKVSKAPLLFMRGSQNGGPPVQRKGEKPWRGHRVRRAVHVSADVQGLADQPQKPRNI